MLFYGIKVAEGYVPIRVDVWLETCVSVRKIRAEGNIGFACRVDNGWCNVPATLVSGSIETKDICLNREIVIEDVLLVNWTDQQKMRLDAKFPITTRKINWRVPF